MDLARFAIDTVTLAVRRADCGNPTRISE